MASLEQYHLVHGLVGPSPTMPREDGKFARSRDLHDALGHRICDRCPIRLGTHWQVAFDPPGISPVPVGEGVHGHQLLDPSRAPREAKPQNLGLVLGRVKGRSAEADVEALVNDRRELLPECVDPGSEVDRERQMDLS